MKKMKDNRGLTLVELLITIAILSIVTVTATSFMVTGSKSFTKANADSDLQQEAELAVNQIEDMVIDTNGGITMEDNEDKAELTMYHAEKENDVTGAEVITYLKEVVVWDKSTDEILYSRWKVIYDEESDQFVEDDDSTENVISQLLTDKVSKFEVDLDTDEETAFDGTTTQIVRAVQIRVGYENTSGRVEYATSPIITLRNRMLLSANPEVIFEKPPTVDANFSLWYKGNGVEPDPATPIIDQSSTVTRGKSYTIYAYLDGSNKDISHLVNWEIEETSSKSTISSLGVLDVGVNEPNDFLTVVAKDKTNPRKTARGVLKVEGGSSKSLKAVHITTRALKPFNPQYGSYVVTDGFTQSEIDQITYKWTVISAQRVENFVDTEKNLDLVVKQEPANYGQLLEIILEAHSDITGETVSDRVTYMIDPEGTKENGDANNERGKLMHADVFHGFTNKAWADKMTVDYYFCNENGQRISEYDYLKEYVELEAYNGGEITYRLSFKEGIPLDQKYYVKVVFYFEQTWTGGTTWTYERIHCLPQVSLYGRTCYANGTVLGNRFIFHYAVDGYYENAVAGDSTLPPQVCKYEVEEFDYTAPSGVIITPKIVQNVTEGDDCTIHVEGEFETTGIDYTNQDQIAWHSMKIKVSLIECPSVYTYVTLLFDAENPDRCLNH